MANQAIRVTGPLPANIRRCLPTGDPLAVRQPAPVKPATVTRFPVGRVPNKTEALYRDIYLRPRIVAGEITLCLYEPLTFRLAHDTRYTPDWVCWLPAGEIELHECKGAHVWDDALVKAKVAAAMFPHRLVLARKSRTGEWTVFDVLGLWTQKG